MIEPWADAPLTNPNDDKLDRSPFVNMVTNLINNLADSNDSAVLGLVGPWGSGKTTVLHYIARQLDKSIKVVRFNPWSFDNDAALQSELYAAILEAFPKGSHRNVRRKAVGLLIRGAPALKVLPNVGDAAAETLAAFLPSKSWDSEFDALAKAIRQARVKILVLVDDVDRLQPKELLILMKTVRLLGRFPRVNYLLAFDRNSTINTLSIALAADRSAAEDYLEKIVQYPLDLPAPQQKFLQNIVFGHLGPVLESGSVSLFRPTLRDRFDSFYRHHMWTTLTTPRACRRYALQAITFLSLADGNVDAADFFALTFLRLFYPNLYNKLPIWKNQLTARPHGEQMRRSEWLQRVTMYGYSEEIALDLLDMIVEIFPRSVPNESSTKGLGGLYRAYDGEYFDRYFNFSLPVGDISDVTVQRDLRRILEGEVSVGSICPETFDHPIPDMQMLAVRKGKRHTLYESDTSNLVHFLVFALSQGSWDYHSVADPSKLKLDWLEKLIDSQRPWHHKDLVALLQRVDRPAPLGIVLTRVMALYEDHARAAGIEEGQEQTSAPAPSFVNDLAALWSPLASAWLVSRWQKHGVTVPDQEILDVWNSLHILHGLSHLQVLTGQALQEGALTLPVLASRFVFPKNLVADYRAPKGELVFDIDKLVASVPVDAMASANFDKVEKLVGTLDAGASWGHQRDRLAIEGLRRWKVDRTKKAVQQTRPNH